MTRDSLGNFYVSSRNDDLVTKVTAAGVDSSFISEALALTINGDTDWDYDGAAFDSLGNVFVVDNQIDGILRFDTGLTGSVFIDGSDVTAVTGATSATLRGIAFAPVIPLPAAVWMGLPLLVGTIAVRSLRRTRAARHCFQRLLPSQGRRNQSGST